LISIENLSGSRFADSLIGNGATNQLLGNAGNDSLNGLAGNDRLIGGDGSDTANYASTMGAIKVDLRLAGAGWPRWNSPRRPCGNGKVSACADAGQIGECDELHDLALALLEDPGWRSRDRSRDHAGDRLFAKGRRGLMTDQTPVWLAAERIARTSASPA